MACSRNFVIGLLNQRNREKKFCKKKCCYQRFIFIIAAFYLKNASKKTKKSKVLKKMSNK